MRGGTAARDLPLLTLSWEGSVVQPEPVSTDIEVLWVYPMSTPLEKELKVLDPEYGIIEPDVEIWE